MRGESEAGFAQPFSLGSGQITQPTGIGPTKEDEPIGTQLQALVVVAKEDLARCADHFWAMRYAQVQRAPRGKGRRYGLQAQRPEKVLSGDIEGPQMRIGDSAHSPFRSGHRSGDNSSRCPL